MYTRVFILEIDKKISQEHFRIIFNKFNQHENLTLVLMNSVYDVKDVIKEYFLNQNSNLKRHRLICLDNLFGIDTQIIEIQTGDNTFIRESFTVTENGKHPFIDITQYNSKRVNLLVKIENEEWVNNINHQFL